MNMWDQSSLFFLGAAFMGWSWVICNNAPYGRAEKIMFGIAIVLGIGAIPLLVIGAIGMAKL